MKVKKICEQCKKEYIADVRPNRIPKYCSQKCMGKAFEKNIKPIKHECPNCNKIFYTPSWKIRKFCTYKCSVEFKTLIRYAICSYCKEAFFVPAFTTDQVGLYCSHKCFEKARTLSAMVEVRCEVCGKLFKRKKGDIRKRKVVFCSRACSIQWNMFFKGREVKELTAFDRKLMDCYILAYKIRKNIEGENYEYNG
ncbi:MAG: hypothetical protein JRI72_17830 [Deltaproteobacteria bacterium]|nr:hypothetical protein [Deltaproteobacteria bacterium]